MITRSLLERTFGSSRGLTAKTKLTSLLGIVGLSLQTLKTWDASSNFTKLSIISGVEYSRITIKLNCIAEHAAGSYRTFGSGISNSGSPIL